MFLLLALMLVLSGTGIADAVPNATPASPAPAVVPSVPAINHEPSLLAADQFNTLQHGQIDRGQYAPTAAAAFSDALVAQTAAYLVPFGTVKSVKLDSTLKTQGSTVYLFTLTCANGTLREMLSLDDEYRIAGIRFMPP